MCLDLFLRCSCTGKDRGLPEQFEFMGNLGEGAFGFVVRCKKKDTNEIVAVKICNSLNRLDEVHILNKLMSHDLHQHNIVRFLGSFSMPSGLALVMEELDITLLEYFRMFRLDLMPLSDIRHIIKQMAVALDALRSVGVIHADITPTNIMMVDHKTQPVRIKLIDFGSAMFTSKAKKGTLLQHRWFRAPEVILGLPFTEAIDMWSLGCLMARMLTRHPLICGWNPDQIMQCIVYHCGLPPDHLLNKGLYTKEYFFRTKTNRWKMKEVHGFTHQCYSFEDEIKKHRLDNKNEAEALMARQCHNLLRAMLTVDPAERITPAEVLLHPFIDEASVFTPDDRTNIEGDDHHPLSKIPLSHHLPVQPAAAENTLRLEDEESSDSLEIHVSKTSRPVSSTSTSDREDPVTAPEERETTNLQPAHHSPSPTISPSRVIYVRPATAENTLRLEDLEDTDSLEIDVSKTSRPVSSTSTSDREDPVTAPEERETTNLQPAHHSPSPTISPSRMIYVRPATAENTLRLEDVEDTDSLEIDVSKTSRPVSSTSTSDREDPVTAPEERETTNLQPAHHSPSPTISPSRMIYVRPATAENTLRLEDLEDTDSLEIDVSKTSRPVSSTSTSDREDPVTAPEERETTNLQPAHHSPSPTISPSRMIYVRPATAENTLRLEDLEDTDSLETDVTKTSRPVSWSSRSDHEDPVTAPEETTNLQPAHHSPSPTISPSRVIYVRPATAENTLRLEDVEDTDSLQAGLKNTSEVPVTVTKSDTTFTEDDSTYYGKKQPPQSPPPVTGMSSKKKKKKNYFRRFFSWMKKTFCSCVTGVDDD